MIAFANRGVTQDDLPKSEPDDPKTRDNTAQVPVVA